MKLIEITQIHTNQRKNKCDKTFRLRIKGHVQNQTVFFSVVQRVVVGDASETALLKFTELTIGNIIDYRARFKKICEVPFNSTNKFQVRLRSNLGHLSLSGLPDLHQHKRYIFPFYTCPRPKRYYK